MGKCRVKNSSIARDDGSLLSQPIRVRSGVRAILGTLLVCAVVAGCGGGTRTPGEERVGDLSDKSYFKARGKARVNADGQRVRMEQYAGKFLWAEYAAPWCAPCGQQASVMRQIEGKLGRNVVVLTIMTSEMGGYGHPATQSTARNWASQHGLNPRRVLAADLTAITIPRHILFSPDGQMLFIKTGYMSADAIRDVLDERTADWKNWKGSGQMSAWMQ